MKSAIDRFFEKVVKSDNGCWLWQGATFRRGYGAFGFKGKLVKAHRFAWQKAYGHIPEGMFVCHHCDTPACVNPAHLFLGTPQENAADRDAKNRVSRMSGEKNPMRKLAQSDVDAIRADTSMSQSQLGAKYGVAQSAISRIKNGVRW